MRYVYDPADPAPTIGGPTSLPRRLLRTNSGPLDQRPLEERPDVLVYFSEPLDEPLEVTGPLSLVAPTPRRARRDTDFVAKLTATSARTASRASSPRASSERASATGYDRPALRRARASRTSTRRPRRDQQRLPAGPPDPPARHLELVPPLRPEPEHGSALGIDGPDDLRRARQTIFHDDARASHLRLPVVDR